MNISRFTNTNPHPSVDSHGLATQGPLHDVVMLGLLGVRLLLPIQASKISDVRCCGKTSDSGFIMMSVAG